MDQQKTFEKYMRPAWRGFVTWWLLAVAVAALSAYLASTGKAPWWTLALALIPVLVIVVKRNMLEFVCGVQIDSRTTMDDFMAEDMVRSEVHGLIRNVEMLKGEWDGECYTVTGRIKTEQLRQIVDLVVTLVR